MACTNKGNKGGLLPRAHDVTKTDAKVNSVVIKFKSVDTKSNAHPKTHLRRYKTL